MNTLKTFSPSGATDRAIIGLHGYTGNRHSLYPIAVGARCPNTKWYFPEAPYDIENKEGKSWVRKDSNGNWDTSEAFAILNQTIAQIQKDGIPPEKTILLGFSQGACLTLEYGLRSHQRLGGLIPIAGFIKYPDQLASQLSSESQQTPILIMHGTKDDIVPPEKGKDVVSLLTAWNRPVSSLWYTAGHKIPVKALVAIRSFVEKI